MKILPDEPSDARNAIVEIRAGAGGEESALFAPTFSGCTPAMLKNAGGRLKC